MSFLQLSRTNGEKHDKSAHIVGASRVENLSFAMGRGINSRNRVWNLVAKLHRLAGQYDNPMPNWFLILTPIAGVPRRLYFPALQ